MGKAKCVHGFYGPHSYRDPVTGAIEKCPRTITAGKPHHEERYFDPYPIRCEVEPWPGSPSANVGTTEDGTSTTDPEATAPSAIAQSFDGDFSGEF